jgi:DNA-directed RNA polymerase subunit RPC12/RpoP
MGSGIGPVRESKTMSVFVQCSQCHKQLKAADVAVGQEVACPDCGTRNYVDEPNFERAVLKRLDRLAVAVDGVQRLLLWLAVILIGAPVARWIIGQLLSGAIQVSR